MPTGSFLRWEQFILQVLENHVNSSPRYLPPGPFCSIDYPTRLRQCGRGSQLYHCAITPKNPGPAYTIEATLWDYSGRLMLCNATFVVPSRESTSSIYDFCAERLGDSVYMVQRALQPSKSSLEMPRVSSSDYGSKVKCSRSDVDILFDIEYFKKRTDDFGRDESQYDLGLFAVRPLDKNATAPHDAYPGNLTEDAELSKLLKPEPFDWSDCDDEVFRTDNPGHIPCNGREITGNRDRSSEETPGQSMKSAGNATLEESCLESVTPSTTTKSDPGSSVLPQADIIRSEPLIVETTQRYDIETESNDSQEGPRCADADGNFPFTHCLIDHECLQDLLSIAHFEKSWQGWWMDNRPHVHHFNWLGEPISERSFTPPEVSLFVILTPPKPWLNSTSRVGTILRQAMKFVDPVLYDGEWGDLARYRGHELLRAITGRVFQFYTAEGVWLQDKYGWDDRVPCYDPADPIMYLAEPWLPVNGWMATLFCPTRHEYVSESSRLMDATKWTRRRFPRPSQRSPLSGCVMMEG
uniref:Uncharacterized protein n=1 Tax=Coccidioides posadasii RMSCC 3488 TaxID=454284 RepID=A0A0J6FA94_COCPO|nr:hypothetical protein CPAG_02225 [Coccidioides posadasii RMSCC 3488]